MLKVSLDDTMFKIIVESFYNKCHLNEFQFVRFPNIIWIGQKYSTILIRCKNIYILS